MTARAPGRRPAIDPAHTTPDPFLWPPREAGGAAGSDTPSRSREPTIDAGPPAGRFGRWIESVEDELVGVRARGFRRRADLAGWTPTPSDRFCWRCGGSVGEHETDGDGCSDCRGTAIPWGRFIRLGPYRDELGEAIRELKFSRWRRIGRELGTVLGERLAARLGEAGVSPSEAAIVPVAPSWTRRMLRGVDHTLVLARAAGRASGAQVVRGLARRHGPSQTSVPASRRSANVTGVFRRTRAAGDLEGVRVVVVLDDIRTTGATLRSAVRALRGVSRSGQTGFFEAERVWAAALAVTPLARRREGE